MGFFFLSFRLAHFTSVDIEVAGFKTAGMETKSEVSLSCELLLASLKKFLEPRLNTFSFPGRLMLPITVTLLQTNFMPSSSIVILAAILQD